MLLDEAAGRIVLEAMLRQGLPAVLVWTEGTAIANGRVTLLVGARDADVPAIYATVTSLASVTAQADRALLSLSDPTDLHLGRPTVPLPRELGMYVLRISRFEQIW